jgi:secernin
MCDTLCGPGAGGMVFAKNSDRPIGEVQLAVPFGRRPTAGCMLHTQYLSIGDTGAHAALLSCPTWLWGAEHGVNEFGVAIGNERVATVHQTTVHQTTVHQTAGARPALIGMDLVRLGLERARSAEEARDILIDLLTTHGQGGIADAARNEAYDSSFLIADPEHAFVLDTSGTDYAAAPFDAGIAISNRFTVGKDWTHGSPSLDSGEDFDRFKDPEAPTASADARLAASRAFLAAQQGAGLTPATTAAHLRGHGDGPWGSPSVCMHVPDGNVTAASLIAVLPSEIALGAPLRAYVALGSPCVSIYVPLFPRSAAGPPPFVPFELSNEALWWAADALRSQVEVDPDALGAIREVLDPVEHELWFEADDIIERPDRWADVAQSWGGRALAALQSCVT